MLTEGGAVGAEGEVLHRVGVALEGALKLAALVVVQLGRRETCAWDGASGSLFELKYSSNNMLR
jgi:hypothetical protein